MALTKTILERAYTVIKFMKRNDLKTSRTIFKGLPILGDF